MRNCVRVRMYECVYMVLGHVCMHAYLYTYESIHHRIVQVNPQAKLTENLQSNDQLHNIKLFTTNDTRIVETVCPNSLMHIRV